MDTVKRELREQDTRIIQAEVRDGKTQRDLYEKYGDLKQDKAVRMENALKNFRRQSHLLLIGVRRRGQNSFLSFTTGWKTAQLTEMENTGRSW